MQNSQSLKIETGQHSHPLNYSIAGKLSALQRTHLICRAYIAAARNERFEPSRYTDELMLADVTANTLATGETMWDESVPVAKVIYKVYGHTGRDQFALGIVEQPGWLENRLICSRLRKAFGDISDTPGFDKQGNLILQKYNDVLIPVWDDRHIVRLDGYATRQLLKMVE